MWAWNTESPSKDVDGARPLFLSFVCFLSTPEVCQGSSGQSLGVGLVNEELMIL